MYFIIARIVEHGNVVGYKIVDTNSYDKNYNNKCGVYTTEKVENAIKARFKIENATLVDGKLKGISGSLGRYSALSTSNELVSEMSIVIINKAEDIYTICTPNGRIIKLSSKALMNRLSCGIKIANGKLCTKENGTKYIAAIEGEIATEDIQLVKSSNNKKFKLSMLNRNHEDYNRIYTRGKEYIQRFKKANPELNYETVVKQYGEAYGIESIHNEVFRSEEISDVIGVTELKYGEYTHFLLNIADTKFLVEDILYIGNGWESRARKVKNKLKINDNNWLIALGQLSLIVIVNPKTQCQYREDKKKENTEIAPLVCIPYCEIDTIEKLTNTLVYYGIPCGILDKSDAYYILKTAAHAIYKLNFNVDLLNIDARFSFKRSEEDDESLLSISSFEVVNFGSSGALYEKDIPRHMLGVINDELNRVFVNYGPVARFSHDEALLTNIKQLLMYSSAKDNQRINYNKLKVKHIVYYYMYKAGLTEKLNTAWVGEESYDTLDKSILYAGVKDDKFIVIINNIRREYDLAKLKEELARDRIELEEIASKAKKLNSKMALIGGEVQLNDEGLICNWDKDTVVRQVNHMNGILIDNRNRDKKIQVYVNRDFEVRDKKSMFGTVLVTCIYTRTMIKGFMACIEKQLNLNSYGITLEEMTADDLDRCISIILREANRYTTVLINGDKKKIGVDTVEIDCSYIIKHANTLFHKEFKLVEHLIFDKEKVDTSEKSKFLNMCINSIPKRNRYTDSTAVKILRNIIGLVCTDDEKDKVLIGLDKWLLK